MPEGHTVHRLARDHAAWFVGQSLDVSSPQGRFENEAAVIDRQTLVAVEAHGKHLFYSFDNAHHLHIHLGLYGKYRVYKHSADTPVPEPRGAVRLRMIGRERLVDLNGPNQCELLDDAAVQDIHARLGPDPLRPGDDPSPAWARITKSRTSIGQLLMDQSVIAGIGNIYRTEILWRVGLHPLTRGNAVSRKQFNAIWTLACELLSLGVKYNRIITVDIKKGGKTAMRLTAGERLNIFAHTTCPRCNGDVEKFTLATRRAYACNACQKVPAIS
jgi:endonuclease VIII